MLRTAVIGVGHLGEQHARIHASLAEGGLSQFAGVCDIDAARAQTVGRKWGVKSTTDWRALIGEVDAVSLAVPTESHCEIACELLDAGIHVLVEKPISRTLEEGDRMIAAGKQGNAVYFEIHRVGQFTARSLDIDVVLDLMIHDLDIVQWLVGEEVEVTSLHAVGIPILTDRVDAANARLEFANGAVANITASRVGTEKIRKMRFFQPRDYVAVDYTTNHASISNLSPPTASPWPGVNTKILDVDDVEPLRAEIESFLQTCANNSRPLVSGEDGRRALALALRTLDQIHAHTAKSGVGAYLQNT